MKTASPGHTLLLLWEKLRGTALGRWFFARLLFWMVPYSGSIGASIVSLEPGHVVVQLRDRRAVRNHLSSIHAMALANLCELTSGLAMLTALPKDARGILTGFSVQYHKKARGMLRAETRVAPIASAQAQELQVQVEARDESGACVTQATAQWKIGPQQ
ncbi:MAG: DUF4442 domain-containing protein [Deltaproteobacteria bacterium]|nr:DUF4442 domain-containing protein [Deltaproteobacteria bacterium]